LAKKVPVTSKNAKAWWSNLLWNISGLSPFFFLSTYSVKNLAKLTLLILAASKWLTNIDNPSLLGSFGVINGAYLAIVQA